MGKEQDQLASMPPPIEKTPLATDDRPANKTAAEMPLVSVVTPFFNTAPYLAECIESIIAQTYRNWEYILLNNCSTDGSAEIARRYASADDRIRVIDADEFVGQIKNYNRAVARISERSRYTKIVEADNWLYPECLEKMVALAEQHESIGVVSSYNVTEHVVRFTKRPYRKLVYGGTEAAHEHMVNGSYLFGAPTTVLFRSSYVRERQPFFPEDGAPAEDLRVCYSIFESGDFGFVPQVLTFIRTDNDSILSAIKHFDAMALDRLVILLMHGRTFLNSVDYGEALKRTRSHFYTRFALGVLTGKGRRFWDFYSGGLRAAGSNVSLVRLATYMLWVIITWIANPGRSLRLLFTQGGRSRSSD